MRTDVVVVGAGMAGLACALGLRDAGAEIVVLEAGDRVGGRVQTVELPDGTWVETGGEWIDTAHANVHALLRRFRLRTVGDAEPWWERTAGWIDRRGSGPTPAERVWLGDDRVRAEFAAFDHLLSTFAVGMPDPSAPDAHPDAVTIDARSAADLFDELDLDEFARFHIGRAINFEYICEPSEISALFLAQQRAVELVEETEYGDVRSQRVEGGLSGLAEAVGSDLGDRVVLGAPVTALTHGPDGVEVRTPSLVVEASHAVLALPLRALRGIEVTPAFEPALEAAIDGIKSGAVTKTFVRVPDRPPFPWVVSDRLTQRVYNAAEDQPDHSAVLDVYVGGDDAIELDRAHPDEVDRLAVIEGELKLMLGDSMDGAEPVLSRSWGTDERFGGGFSVWGPGSVTRHWRILREAHGRVHLAGEHAGTVCGYVEGAVESGNRVATRLVALG